MLCGTIVDFMRESGLLWLGVATPCWYVFDVAFHCMAASVLFIVLFEVDFHILLAFPIFHNFVVFF